MKANVIGNGAVVVALCAAIGLPLLVWRHVDNEARARDEALRKQKETIEALTTANAKRKQELAAGNADALTDEQMRELLRLRAEAGALRKETNNLARSGAANTAKLTPEEQAQRAQELSGELLEAARRIVAELPEVERRFRERTGSRLAAEFSRFERIFSNRERKTHAGIIYF